MAMGIVTKSFGSGEVIIREGEAGTSFFKLNDGNVGVYSDYGVKDKEPFRVALLSKGDYFGEMAIIESDKRSATIVAECSVKVTEIPKTDMNAYFEENPDEIYLFMKHLGNKVRQMISDYDEAKALLKSAQEEAASKKSLFSIFKKRINQYQPPETDIPEPDADYFRRELEKITDEGSGRIKSYAKGDVIYKPGDKDNCMFIVRGGTVSLTDKDNSSKDLTEVSFFGEMGLIADESRTETATVTSDEAYVEIIYPDDLPVVFNACPIKINLILTYLSFRLRRLTIDFVDICKEITENYG